MTENPFPKNSIDISNDRIIIQKDTNHGLRHDVYNKNEIDKIILSRDNHGNSQPYVVFSFKIHNSKKENTFVKIEGLEIKECVVENKIAQILLYN